MKKIVLCAMALLLAACAGMNKNTVNYQMGGYDSVKYYVVAGEGMSKEEAAQNALENMRREMVQNAPAAANQGVVTDLMANAEVEKVWRDKDFDGKHFYALAVLSRSKAHKVLAPLLDQEDAKLEGLAKQFAAPASALADLKVAFKMQPVVARRAALDEMYQFLNASRESYQPEVFAPYKAALQEKMAAVLVGVDVTGVQSEVLVTYVVDALNRMGLGVVDASDPDKVLLVQIATDVDAYDSQKVEGLVWCSSGASVSLVDVERGVTFSRFNVHERAGTSRAEDSLRKSMQSVGEQASAQISSRLKAYLNIN